jgi:glycosyltransferase involved in cell wall biosynthesis
MFKFNPDERERIRRELALAGKFVAIYAGIFGLAQGLETILEAALILKNNPSLHFILIGDGPRKQEIIALSNRYNLPNFSLLPELPRESIPGYLSAADISIIPLRKVEIFKGALPSKIFDAWACSRPVLISIDGEAREMVENINGGVFIPPENPKIMAESLLKLMDSPNELVQMGETD